MVAIVFRAESMHDMFTIFRQMFLFNMQEVSLMAGTNGYHYTVLIIFGIITALIEAAQRDKPLVSDWINQNHLLIRWSFYILLMISILSLGIFSTREYIYFQF